VYDCEPSLGVRQVCASRLDESGQMDLTYGTTGSGFWAVPLEYATPPPITSPSSARVDAVVIRPSGSIVWAGDCIMPSGTHRRCGGHVQLSGSSVNDSGGPGAFQVWPAALQEVSGLALQPDGKVLLAGRCDRDGCVLRYEPTLTLDASFADSGVFRTRRIAFANSAAVGSAAITVREDGKITLAYQCATSAINANPGLCMYRLEIDGVPDYGFGDNGATLFTEPVIPPEASGPFYVPFALHAARFSEATAARAKYLSVGYCLPAICESGSCDFDYDAARVCTVRFNNGPFEHRACNGDIDGDGLQGTVEDQLLFARTAIGFTGTRVVAADTYRMGATRVTWPAVRDYLSNHCAMRVSR
jgi:hypothetical protein